ncbi:MAG: hypothetical protein HON76_05430 [Candidatus Scalindua sp.]|jgi:hypothetical protein|nr:hypothetical protein [Candidatus Scalindua sp.]MBT6561951.1 hypothetical protein [Candidatus Scalindua sp.]
MKVLIVFSSPMGTDRGKWEGLTNFKPTKVGVDGLFIAYDGQDRKYSNNEEWNLSTLRDEINSIVGNEDDGNEYIVLLHTQDDDDLQVLEEVCVGTKTSILKKFSTNDDLYDDYIRKLDVNSAESFNKLWYKLQEKEIDEKIPVEGTKTHARKSAEYISNHNCSNIISYLKIPIEKLKDDIALDRENAKKTILDFGEDLVKKYYNNSIRQFERLIKVFPDNPEINKIPGLLTEAKEKYAIMYEKAKCAYNDFNKVIVENGQIVIQLHQETIDILKKEVLQNGEEDL